MDERKKRGENGNRRGNIVALALVGSATLSSSVVLPQNYPQPVHSQVAGETHNPIHRKPSKAKHEPRDAQAVLRGDRIHSSSKALAPIHDSHPRVSHRISLSKLNSSGTLYHTNHNRPILPNTHREHLHSQRTPLPELVSKYLQRPESFIQLALNTNLSFDQTRERKMLTGIESAISGKFEQRLAHKVAKAFESKLNGQLTLLAKGQIDEKTFQDVMQEQVAGFLDYLKEQKAQGLPNLESLTLAGLLFTTIISVTNLRKDIFSHKN